jgi:hypothetical protein
MLFRTQNPPIPLIVARHCSKVTKPQLVGAETGHDRAAEGVRHHAR